jgi:ankyrin repeat protein
MSSSNPGLFNICKTKNWHKVGPYCHRYGQDDVEYIDAKSGGNALHEACRHQPPARVVQSLLTVQPLLTTHVNADGDLPLHTACRHQASLTVLRLLLESNVSTARARDGKAHHTAISILCGQTNSETTMKSPNYKSIFWQKIRLLLLAVSSDRKGLEGIIIFDDTDAAASHLLHAAVDVGAPEAVLQFCLEELIGDHHQRDSRGQYPLHVAVNRTKESTAGVNPVFRMAKTSTIERLLQAFPASASALDTENQPVGRYPIHTALLNDHDWFSGVRELARCAPDLLLADDPEWGVKPFELAKDIETTFQLLRRMPHALEASRGLSIQYYDQPEVHVPVASVACPVPEKVVASAAFVLPEKDLVVVVPTLCSADLHEAARCGPELEKGSAGPAPFEKPPSSEPCSSKSVSRFGFALAKAMIKSFRSSPNPQKSSSETLANNGDSESAPSGQRSITSASEDKKVKPRSADPSKTSSAAVATTFGQLRLSSVPKMTTIVEQGFEEDEDDDTESTMDDTESSDADSHECTQEVKPTDDVEEAGSQSRMLSLEKLEKSVLLRPISDGAPSIGDSGLVSSLRQRRNAFLDRLVTKPQATMEPLALAKPAKATSFNEAKEDSREEEPTPQINLGTQRDLCCSDDDDATQRGEVKPISADSSVVNATAFNKAKAMPRDEKPISQVNPEASADRRDEENDDVEQHGDAQTQSSFNLPESKQVMARTREEKPMLHLYRDSNNSVNHEDKESDSWAISTVAPQGKVTPIPADSPVYKGAAFNQFEARQRQDTPLLQRTPETDEDNSSTITVVAQQGKATRTSVLLEGKGRPINRLTQNDIEDNVDPNGSDEEGDSYAVPGVAQKGKATSHPAYDGVGQSKSYNKYKTLLTAHPAAVKDPRKAWRNDVSTLY